MPRPLQAAQERAKPRAHVLPPLRVNELEREQIKAKARAAGLSVSEYQRRACLNVAIEAAPARLPRGDVALVRELSAIGNLLNQLTRKAHIFEEVDQIRLRAVLKVLGRTMEGLTHDR